MGARFCYMADQVLDTQWKVSVETVPKLLPCLRCKCNRIHVPDANLCKATRLPRPQSPIKDFLRKAHRIDAFLAYVPIALRVRRLTAQIFAELAERAIHLVHEVIFPRLARRVRQVNQCSVHFIGVQEPEPTHPTRQPSSVTTADSMRLTPKPLGREDESDSSQLWMKTADVSVDWASCPVNSKLPFGFPYRRRR